ncbi:MAG: hypothetical protein AB1646_10825 [Thermodesulfobacteriota bacterium]
MDETPQRKNEMKPVEVIGSEGAVTSDASGPEQIPWAEIMGDDAGPDQVHAAVADSPKGSAVSEPERFDQAPASADPAQEQALPWAEIVPDDLGYMSEPERSEALFLSAQAGEAMEVIPPWAEILDQGLGEARTSSEAQQMPQIVSQSEQADPEDPYPWYHEPTPIPIPIMPIAFFQLIVFVLFW